MSFVGHFSVITDFTLELLVRLIVIVYEGPDLCAPFENQISGHIINLILLNYLTNLALHIMVRVLTVLKTIVSNLYKLVLRDQIFLAAHNLLVLEGESHLYIDAKVSRNVI